MMVAELDLGFNATDITKWINLALEARQRAYAPYSQFLVGAALVADSGVIYQGCNVENAAFGETICAERGAIMAAIAAGERKFCAIVVCGGKADQPLDQVNLATPCGSCRQVLTEFCPCDFPVILCATPSHYKIFRLAELLPHSFTEIDLNNRR